MDATIGAQGGSAEVRWYAKAIAMWPLVFVFVGGAVGLACGGAASAVNLKLARPGRSLWVHSLISFAVGVAGFVVAVVASVLMD